MDFKLYFLDETGRIERRVDLERVDETAAHAAVSDHGSGQAMELWCGAQRLRKYHAGWVGDS